MSEIDSEMVAQELERLAATVRASSVRKAEFDSEADLVSIPRGRFMSHYPSGFETHTVKLHIRRHNPGDDGA